MNDSTFFTSALRLKSVPGFAAPPTSEGRVETGKMGVSALGTSFTPGETRRGLRVSPTRSLTGRLTWSARAALGAALLSLSTPARAQSNSEGKAAAEHAGRAQVAYDLQDWLTAINEFRAAYQIEQKPEYLWGVAQAQRASGDCKSAIPTFKAYRRRDVTQTQATAAELLVTRCESEIEKQELEAARAGKPASEPASDLPARTLTTDEPATGSSALAARPAPNAEPPEPKHFYKDPLGDILLVTGVAAVGVGTYFIFAGNSHAKSAEDADTYGGYQEHVDSASGDHVIGAIAGIGGALLMGGAVVRYLTFDPSPESEVSIGLGSVTVSGQF